MTEFYHLHSPYDNDNTSPSYGEIEWANKFKLAEWGAKTHNAIRGIICPSNPQHNRAADRSSDLHLIISTPYLGDFIWTWQGECVITERLLNKLRQAQLYGFDVRPVTVEPINVERGGFSEVTLKFWELVIIGKGGNPLPRSGIRLIYKCDSCGLQRYSSYSNGIHIDKNQWDGSDFFSINSYPRLIFVSERVHDFIRINKLDNCFLTPSKHMRWPAGVIKPEDIYPQPFN